MSKPLVLSALAQFTAKTAGRNMTKAAYAAVAAGVAAMVVLTVAPAYEVAHHWVDAVLWVCLVYFVFEWLVRLRHMARQGRGYGSCVDFRLPMARHPDLAETIDAEARRRAQENE